MARHNQYDIRPMIAGLACCVIAVMVSAGHAQETSPSVQAAAVKQKALDYLKAQQQPDGSWQQANMPPAFTALVVRGFALDAKYGTDSPLVKKGYEALLRAQNEQGAFSEKLQTNYNTAIAISALAVGGSQYKAAMDRSVAFLRNLQWSDDAAGPDTQRRQVPESDARFGGWGYGHHSRPDGSNLQMAIEALHDAGVQPDDPAYKNAIIFLSRMQNRSESNDQSWSGDDGGFVYTPANEGNSPAGEYTGPDGGRRLRSYASMTSAGFKSMIYAGLSREDPRVQAAWQWINAHWSVDTNVGMGEANPAQVQDGLYYNFLTMARALHAYGEPLLKDSKGQMHDWRVELMAKLAGLQKPDGSFSGEKRWMEDNPVLVTAYCVLAIEEIQQDLQARPAK